MALSIAQGLKATYKIEVVGRSLDKINTFEKALGITITKALMDDYDMSDKTIMLCVKPANIEEISTRLSGKAKVIYSVLAGTSLQKLKQNLNPNAVVRTMPNLAASVRKSMTPLTGDIEFKDEAEEQIGRAHV